MKSLACFSMCRQIDRQISKFALVYLLSKISNNKHWEWTFIQKYVLRFQYFVKKLIGEINFHKQSKQIRISLSFYHSLKVGLTLTFQNICFNENSLKIAFHFILKVLLVLNKFDFFSWLFGHAEKTAWLKR